MSAGKVPNIKLCATAGFGRGKKLAHHFGGSAEKARRRRFLGAEKMR